MIVAAGMYAMATRAMEEGKMLIDVDAEALAVVADRARLVFPEPTPYFSKVNSIDTQVLHMIEELGEISKELRRYNEDGISEARKEQYRTRMANEIGDAIISGFTALQIIGYGEKERSKLFSEIIEGNKARGYYE